jgi:hypothetical protein
MWIRLSGVEEDSVIGGTSISTGHSHGHPIFYVGSSTVSTGQPNPTIPAPNLVTDK